jgi:hypothetical protein
LSNFFPSIFRHIWTTAPFFFFCFLTRKKDLLIRFKKVYMYHRVFSVCSAKMIINHRGLSIQFLMIRAEAWFNHSARIYHQPTWGNINFLFFSLYEKDI